MLWCMATMSSATMTIHVPRGTLESGLSGVRKPRCRRALMRLTAVKLHIPSSESSKSVFWIWQSREMS